MPISPPQSSMARFEITSLTFMFVCVPEPVCQTKSGKWSASLPSITSSAAATIGSHVSCGILPRSQFTSAAAFLSTAIARITAGRHAVVGHREVVQRTLGLRAPVAVARRRGSCPCCRSRRGACRWRRCRSTRSWPERTAGPTATSRSAIQDGDDLDVARVREQVDRRGAGEVVAAGLQQADVAAERRRVARDEHDPRARRWRRCARRRRPRARPGSGPRSRRRPAPASHRPTSPRVDRHVVGRRGCGGRPSPRRGCPRPRSPADPAARPTPANSPTPGVEVDDGLGGRRAPRRAPPRRARRRRRRGVWKNDVAEIRHRRPAATSAYIAVAPRSSSSAPIVTTSDGSVRYRVVGYAMTSRSPVRAPQRSSASVTPSNVASRMRSSISGWATTHASTSTGSCDPARRNAGRPLRTSTRTDVRKSSSARITGSRDQRVGVGDLAEARRARRRRCRAGSRRCAAGVMCCHSQPPHPASTWRHGGVDAVGRRLEHLEHATAGERLLRGRDLDPHRLAGDRALDHHDAPVGVAGERLAPGDHLLRGEVERCSPAPSGLYLMRWGWSASAPRRLRRSVS